MVRGTGKLKGEPVALAAWLSGSEHRAYSKRLWVRAPGRGHRCCFFPLLCSLRINVLRPSGYFLTSYDHTLCFFNKTARAKKS